MKNKHAYEHGPLVSIISRIHPLAQPAKAFMTLHVRRARTVEWQCRAIILCLWEFDAQKQFVAVEAVLIRSLTGMTGKVNSSLRKR